MNNYLDTFDEVAFSLEWRRMIGIAGSERFDMEKFQHLAKNTYSFLASFDNDEKVAREYLGSMLLIHEFATLPPVFLNREGKAAVRIMSYLLDSFINNNISYDCPYIQIEDEEGNFHQIDTNTFDLSELL